MKRGISQLIIIAGIVLLTAVKPSTESLAQKNEKIILSFSIQNSQKIMTLSATTSQPGYIVYRFGTKNNIEIEYPPEKTSSWDKFTYDHYLRAGGPENEMLDLNYVSFTNKEFTYTIFEEYSNNAESIGIRVKNTKTGKETTINGDRRTKIGSLITLRDEDRIQKKQ